MLMRTTAFVFSLALLVTPALAADIAVKDVAAHVGQTATVVGMVDNVHQSHSNMIFIDMGGAYPNNAFSAVVFAKDAGKFPNLMPLKGKKVGITGKIELYNNKPEIVLHTADQVKMR
jgi:exonuclease VII large subunit